MPSVNIAGTGADDTIVITASGADSISVNLNGSVTNYSNVTQLTVDGNAGNDTVTIVNPTGGLLSPVSGIVINGGGQPGDKLNVIGGVASIGAFTPGASPDAGTLNHTSSEVQQVTVNGSSGTFTLTFNGQTTSELAFNATAAEVLAALTALSTVSGAGGTASVTQVGSVYSVSFGGAFMNSGLAQMTASGSAGATATVNTLFNGGTNNIGFTGLTAVVDTVSASAFTINGTSGTDTISITDGANIGGALTTTVSSPTLASISFANKGIVSVNGSGGGDTLTFNNPTLATGQTTMLITGVGAVTQTGAIKYNDLAIAADGPVTLTNAANDVTNIAAALSGQSFAYNDADDISITTLGGINGLSTLNGSIAVTTTNGPIVIANTIAAADVNAGSAAVVLTAGSTGGSDHGVQLAGGADISGSGGIELRGDHLEIGTAATINAGSGTVTVLPFQAGTLISFGSADAAGVLGLTDAELDGITAGVLKIGDGASGTISFNGAISPAGIAQLELTTGGSIQDNLGLLDVTVAKLAMTAITGIGIGGASAGIKTNISNLEARTTTGGINVMETFGDLTIGGVSASLAGVQVVTSGNINLTADANIVLAETIVGGTAGGNVAIAADTDVTSTANINAITSPRGSVSVTAGRDIALGNGPSFDNDIRADGNVTLTAGGDITIAGDADIVADAFDHDTGGGITATAAKAISVSAANGNDASLFASADIVLTAGANQLVTLASSPSGGSVHSAHADVTINADRLAITGSGIASGEAAVTIQPVSSAWAVNLGAASDATASTLELSDAELDRISAPILRIGNFSSTGDLSVSSQITADGHYSTLSLRTGGAILDATAGEQTDITVGNLALRAAGIGGVEDLDTAVSKIAISSSSSAAARISNTGALIIGSVDLLNASIGGGVTEFKTTGGPLTVATDLLSKSAMSLSVADSPAAGDNLVINSGVAVQSNVSITLLAGDNLLLSTGATVQAVGSVSASIDSTNADAGAGGLATLAGSLSGAAVAINGAGDVDTWLFNGSDVNEAFGFSASGGHVTFTRNVGNVVMDVNDIEHLILNTGAGSDTVTINDLSGTDVTGILLDLAGTVGGSVGDGVFDQVTINGSANADVITVASSNGGFTALVNIAHADSGDWIGVNGGAGNDIIDLSGITPGSMYDSINGGLGDDIITGIGNSDIIGGAGNDVYFINVATDYPVESAGEGSDAVYASINYTLTPNVENLYLPGAGDLYGAGNASANFIQGNSGNNVIDGLGGGDVMQGGAGNDAYFADNAGDTVIESVGEGNDAVYASLSFALAANIENLYLQGTGDFSGTGNALANFIQGNSGNNVLNGLGGADTMQGGAGSDAYFVDNSGDAVVENAGEGNDAIYSGVSYSLAANIENLYLQGNGDFSGTGNGLVNFIQGNSGNNVLNGLGGGDTMQGGAGSDAYFVDNAGDTILENAAEGTDAVYAMVSHTLAANVENLFLQGTGDFSASGNGLNNFVQGNSGNNVLNGLGGADTMAGGVGGDAYFVDNAGDAVVEAVGEGSDAVYASVSHLLSLNVENLYLQGVGDLAGSGNALSNFIQGNTGNNALDGLGGADAMQGGVGNDAYFVDNMGDVVTENAAEGSDAVYANLNYTLTANVENLYLQGNGDFSATGNGLNNFIQGNTGNNALNGGVGADAMIGGIGNDAYFVDNAGDVVTENPGEGIDAVYSTITYALTAPVENLYLQGSADIVGVGNSLANYIQGNSGNNTLNGGQSADALEGGVGNDTFVFNAGQANGDVIIDFNGNGAAVGDSIQFVGYGAGVSLFNINPTQWQIDYNGGASHDIITFANAAALHGSDFSFI